MALLAPLWLLALFPWAAFSIWLWVGRRRRQWVPFLNLWDAPQELRRPKRGVEPPPVGLILTILAMLAGLLAMTRPVLISPTDRGPVTIIVDRGGSMSAIVAGKSRFTATAETVGPELIGRLGQGAVELIDVVDGSIQQTDRSDWMGRVAQWKRTALDTSVRLAATVRQRLAMGETVIVLSDQDVGIVDPKLVIVRPSGAVRNAGIVALAARPGQVMVTLHAADAMPGALHVRAGDRSTTVAVAAVTDQNLFVTLDAAGADTIEAWLDGSDDDDADDRAWLVRQRDWATVEPRVPLSDELRRMVAVYGRHRPAGAGSMPLPIARPGELKAEERGVVLAPADGTEAPGEVGSQAHVLTAGVDFSAVGRGAAVAQRGPGEGWQRVAWVGGKTIVAVRGGGSEGPRQVWIGFESREFARTTDFVVFWTNVFDWLAGGTEGFAAGRVGQSLTGGRRVLPGKLSDGVDDTLWPGVFETAQGKVAANAGPIVFRSDAGRGWADQLSRLRLEGAGARPLSPALAVAALILVLGAAWRWERRRTPRTGPVGRLDVEEVSQVQTMVPADGLAHPHRTTARPPGFLDRSG